MNSSKKTISLSEQNIPVVGNNTYLLCSFVLFLAFSLLCNTLAADQKKVDTGQTWPLIETEGLLTYRYFAQNQDQQEIFLEAYFEAESGIGDGTLMSRSEASNGMTVWFHNQESRRFTFNLTEPGLSMEVSIRYSNDGPRDFIRVILDEQEIGFIHTINTKPAGYPGGAGWNIFASDMIVSQQPISLDDHIITLKAETDFYGCEIDNVNITVYGLPKPTDDNEPNGVENSMVIKELAQEILESRRAEIESGKWQFSQNYTIESLEDPAVATEFLREYLYWEHVFWKLARNPNTGITFDGYNLSELTGLPADVRFWSAPSKEALDITILILALDVNPIACYLISPDNPEQASGIAAEILAKKLASYFDWYENQPGYGGFLPWFFSGAAISPTNDWVGKLPGLDNGEWAWAMYVAAYALDQAGYYELANNYQEYNSILRRNSTKVFFDEDAGEIRGDVIVVNPESAETEYLTLESVQLDSLAAIDGLTNSDAEALWKYFRDTTLYFDDYGNLYETFGQRVVTIDDINVPPAYDAYRTEIFHVLKASQGMRYLEGAHGVFEGGMLVPHFTNNATM